MTNLSERLQLAALVVGFAGAFALAWAQQAVPGDVQGWKPGPGKPVQSLVVLRHPRIWKIGLAFVVISFALQLLSLWFK